MKIWSTEHVFYHPWETVAKAAWRKYPNPMNNSVVGVDVVERRVEPTGKFVSINSKSNMFSTAILKCAILRQTETESCHEYLLFRQFLGLNPTCYASEHSLVDAQEKVLRLKSKNITLNSYVSIDEELVYRPHPTLKNATLLRQEAIVTVNGFRLAGHLESLVTNTISSKSAAGRDAMEWVIQTINQEMKDLASQVNKSMEDIKHSMEGLNYE
ncbi:PRELI domain containing protein 3A-like [Acanthaster planci]|uniref:PRELI domain containing protein 3A-like n=1 Tax=Acanthaster planci TaxID=133434 RepID=A0A8B7ZY70_ACAPL|nr:PRELI domain containing protein 3A-like [Acanthaster planci]